MMKKEFDMSDLVENLASDTETGTEQSRVSMTRRQSARKKKMEHVCTLIDTEQMAKIRAIAEREGIALKDIFAVGLNMAISNYEQKNGTIRIKPTKKGNASDVFGI